MSPEQIYLQNQVSSASPIGLIIMLYKGLEDFALQASEHIKSLDQENQRLASEKIDRCIKIITELNNALNHEQEPDFSNRMKELYEFFIAELGRANVEKNPKIITDILPMIKELKEGWQEAEHKIAESGTSSGSLSVTT